MIPPTNLDLFAGIPVADYAAALSWYQRLLGSEPSFFPNDREAVWELAPHRYVYIVLRPEHAGHAVHLSFVDDLDALVAQIADRGLDPAERETYSNGVRKITYRDPDGNEIGLGDAPLEPEDALDWSERTRSSTVRTFHRCDAAVRKSHTMRNEVALGVNRLLDHGRSSTSTSSERSWRACVMRGTRAWWGAARHQDGPK
jgi:catechol 2,3-dioxygenase-like lactoylglutathione lyase family enzyme